MKYLTFRKHGAFYPEFVIFTDSFEHSKMKDMISPTEIIGAGFVKLENGIKVYDYSSSLKVTPHNRDIEILAEGLHEDVKFVKFTRQDVNVEELIIFSNNFKVDEISVFLSNYGKVVENGTLTLKSDNIICEDEYVEKLLEILLGIK